MSTQDVKWLEGVFKHTFGEKADFGAVGCYHIVLMMLLSKSSVDRIGRI
jgi:hypothetical protein